MEVSTRPKANKSATAKPGIADEILAKANAAVEKLSAEYPDYALRDIENLANHINQMADGKERQGRFNEISRIAHDMRGQGTIFGFPLMTRCAGSLCRATRELEPRDDLVPAIIGAHVAAMRAILENRVTGARDVAGLTVATGLELLVASRANRRPATGSNKTP